MDWPGWVMHQRWGSIAQREGSAQASLLARTSLLLKTEGANPQDEGLYFQYDL